MTNRQPTLRFDHREIAVIFSLFVFVSLLMFTVGILVGKGLAQAKYEGLSLKIGSPTLSQNKPIHERTTASAVPSELHPSGTSVSSGDSLSVAPFKEKPAPQKNRVAENGLIEDAPLKLMPQKSPDSDDLGGSLLEPKQETSSDQILSNPNVQSLVEEAPSRHVTSTELPESFSTGKFSVQVDSYTTEKEASDRVDELKKLGFPYSYFSAKELGENKDVWYRVWLGYYPDYQSANDSGRKLQNRGEVKHYLVRKADSNS